MHLFIFFISSAKKNLPSQSGKIQQKTTSRSHNNTSVLQNSQGSNAANDNEQDDSMFDDDLDITELDQALLGGKTPLSSQKAQEKDDTMKNHKSKKTEPVLTSQRYMFYCMITAIFEVIQSRNFILTLWWQRFGLLTLLSRENNMFSYFLFQLSILHFFSPTLH